MRSRRFLALALPALLMLAPSFAAARAKKAADTSASGDGRKVFAQLNDKDKYWLNAEKEVYKKVPELVAQHRDEIARDIRLDKIMHGPLGVKEIAITFDDGPHPGYTHRILDMLKRNNVKATFFLVGMLAEKHPDLVKAEAAAGHTVGNHTYHHVNLTKIPQGYVAAEIEACGDVLRSILGDRPNLFRPPGGDYDAAVAQVATTMGYRMVLWTDDPGDYASPGERAIYNHLIDDATNGGIILIHDGIEQTIRVLPKVITTLRRQGYKFVTIDQLIKDRRPDELARGRKGSQL